VVNLATKLQVTSHAETTCLGSDGGGVVGFDRPSADVHDRTYLGRNASKSADNGLDSFELEKVAYDHEIRALRSGVPPQITACPTLRKRMGHTLCLPAKSL
jgi:hypothetical protein